MTSASLIRMPPSHLQDIGSSIAQSECGPRYRSSYPSGARQYLLEEDWEAEVSGLMPRLGAVRKDAGLHLCSSVGVCQASRRGLWQNLGDDLL